MKQLTLPNISCGVVSNRKYINNGNLYDEDALQWVPNMKFDVVVGNPPYQKGNLTGHDLYPEFVVLAESLSKTHTCMITPHKWVFKPKLKKFKTFMLQNAGLKLIKHFAEKDYIFGRDVVIKGGVSYFVCEKGYTGDVVVSMGGVNTTVNLLQVGTTRFLSDKLKPILDKLKEAGTFTYNSNHKLISKYTGFTETGDVPVYLSRGNVKYITLNEAVSLGKDFGKWKLLIPNAGSANNVYKSAIVAPPNSTSSESKNYIIVQSQQEAENMKIWLSMVVVRFMLSLIQPSHNLNGGLAVLDCPDLSKVWTDADTQTHFNLTDEEMAYMKTCVEEFDIDKE